MKKEKDAGDDEDIVWYTPDDPINEDLEQTIDSYKLQVSTWMDAGGRLNPVLFDRVEREDYAIVMVDERDTYRVVNVASLEDIEDGESLYADSDFLDRYTKDGCISDRRLSNVFADMTEYSTIASYLNEQQVVADSVNDGLVDGVRRYLTRRDSEEAV